MPAIRRILALALVGLPLPAHAHLGHVGELAGHSHWLGYGALAAAAAALALLPKKKKQAAKAEDTPGDEEANPEAEESA